MTEPTATTPAPEGRRHAVYDAHYARPAEVTPEELAADPKRFQPLGAQSVRMIDNEGQPIDVPAANAMRASVEGGYQFLGDEEAAKQGQVQFWHDHYSGAFNVGVHEMANQMLFGVPDVLEEHREGTERRAGHQAAKAEHKTARIIGGGLGVLGGAVMTAGAGEAVSAIRGGGIAAEGLAAGRAAGQAAAEQVAPGLLSRVLGATARGATEGAAFSAPTAAAQVAFGDNEKAAESVLWGIGTGGLLGFAGGSFAEASRAAKEKVGALAPKLGELLPTPSSAASAREAAGAELAEHSSLLDKSIDGARTSWDRQAAKRAQEMGVVPSELAGKVSGTLVETRPGLAIGAASKGERAMQEAAADAAKTIAALGDKPISFGELQGLRSKLAAEAVGTTPRANVMRQVDAIVGAEQQRAMAQAYAALPLKADYADFLATLERAQGAMGSAVAMGGPSKLAQMAGAKLSSAATNAAAGVAGGVLGSAIGGDEKGAGFGALAAMGGHRLVNPLLKRVLGAAIERHGTDIAGRVLGRIAGKNEQWFGASFAKSMVDATARSTKEGVRALAKGTGKELGTAAITKSLTPDDVIAGYLGSKGSKGLTRSQQWSRVVQTVLSSQSGPEHAAERAAVAEVFGSHPELAAAVDRKLATANAYVAGVVQKHAPPADTAPFRTGPPPELTAQQKAPIARAIEVVDNPHAVMAHVAAGTLTRDHVEALKAVYPEQHAALVAETAQLAATPELAANVPLGVRVGLEKLTGVPVTNPRGINFQASYHGPQAQGQGHGQQGVPKPRPSKRPHVEFPELGTNTQRIEHKEH